MKQLKRLLAELRALVLAAFNSSIAWAIAIWFCIEETTAALAFNPVEGVAVGIACFGKLAFMAHELNAPKRVQNLVVQIQHELQRLQLSQGGGSTMPCVTTHRTSGKVQGPGLCCSQVGVA